MQVAERKRLLRAIGLALSLTVFGAFLIAAQLPPNPRGPAPAPEAAHPPEPARQAAATPPISPQQPALCGTGTDEGLYCGEGPSRARLLALKEPADAPGNQPEPSGEGEARPDLAPPPRVQIPTADEPAPAPSADQPPPTPSEGEPSESPGPSGDPPPTDDGPRRVRVRGEDGQEVVARVYGDQNEGLVLLPDGRLGWTRSRAYTSEPFRALTADELEARLREGPFSGFHSHRTEHYLVLYRCSRKFAEDSARLLESLYKGLFTRLASKGFAVEEPPFPLVAIIFAHERDFRAYEPIDDDVQAYYSSLTNRIVFYETSERDQNAPDVAARRRPQTVAHEGTHQVLQNIGVHPRLSSWPPWLVEGLAEYFAPTSTGRQGDWIGGNRINPFHMATIRDLNDPLSAARRGPGAPVPRARPAPGSVIEALVRETDLSPTDYALSWALTHYLVNKRFDDFLAYLKEMSLRPPLKKAKPEEHLADFRRHFGAALPKLERQWHAYLAGLKGYENLVYFTVTFEQPVGPGVVRRAALVSQSPAMVRQWLDEMHQPQGGQPVWNVYRFPTRTRAELAAQGWLNASR